MNKKFICRGVLCIKKTDRVCYGHRKKSILLRHRRSNASHEMLLKIRIVKYSLVLQYMVRLKAQSSLGTTIISYLY